MTPCAYLRMIGGMEKIPMQPTDPISKHFRLVDAQKKALARLGLTTLLDLLYHFPARHIDAGKSSAIEFAEENERITLYGQIEKTATKKSFRTHVPMGESIMRLLHL